MAKRGDLTSLVAVSRRYESAEEVLNVDLGTQYGLLSDFAPARKALAGHEGGNDDDPVDPGGRTSRGIIQREYDAYRRAKGLPTRDVWKADDVEVDDIYKAQYWNAMRCDDLPAGVDYAVFDYGVNSGIGRAPKVLQRVVGAAVDGKIGPETLRLTNAAEPRQIINAICDERLNFLRSLSTYWHFGKGWERRVSEVRALSLKMAQNPAAPAPKPPTPTAPVAETESWFTKLLKWARS